MSQEITTAHVKQYSANVYHLAQQKKSRLRNAVRVEPVTGEEAYFDQIGATTANEVFDRHGDSPQNDTPHSRRRVAPRQFDWGDFIDKWDDVKTLIDPKNRYVQAGTMALGRAIDDVIIDAALGTALTGQTGGTSVTFPSAQNIGTTASNDGLTIAKLVDAKGLFWKNDVDTDDPENMLYMAVAGKQLEDLLDSTTVTSSDYNTVKALVKGEINTFMGFEFIRTERLPRSATDVRSCIAFAKSGLLLGVNADVSAEITKRADKRFSWYAYACMSLGATRMEEEKVVQVFCDETPD